MSRPTQATRVAVIGAGAAGLAAARRVLEHGAVCTLFDPSPQVGGCWADPASPIWPSLRTNLPIFTMQFHDYSFEEAHRADLSTPEPSESSPDYTTATDTAVHTQAAESTNSHCNPEESTPRGGHTESAAPKPPSSLPSFVSAAVMARYLQAYFHTFIARFATPRTGVGASGCSLESEQAEPKDSATAEGQEGGQLTVKLRCRVVDVKRLSTPSSNGGLAGWAVSWRDLDSTNATSNTVNTTVADATSESLKSESTRDGPRAEQTGPTESADADETAEFDAVIVANGHYSEPFEPAYPGATTWPGEHLHSAEFETSARWAGKRVVVAGAKSSGTDIARELLAVGCEVHVADTAKVETSVFDEPPISHHPPIESLEESGAVEFSDGTRVEAVDAIINCTGYLYSFPFLRDDVIKVEDRGVHAVYRQMFTMAHPSLVFIGLPWVIIPFPLFDFQAELAARVLTGKAALPPLAEREADLAAWTAGLDRPRSTHKLAALQFDYCRGLARLGGFFTSAMDTRLRLVESVYRHVGASRAKVVGGADSYRDAVYTVLSDTSFSVADAAGSTVRVDVE